MTDSYLEGCDVLGEIDEILGATWTPAPSLDNVRAGQASLREGMEGEPVRYVQAMTGAIVDKGPARFGPNTKKAVTAFQLARGLSATGVVDRATLAKIDELAGPGAGKGTPANLDSGKGTPANLDSWLAREIRSAAGVPVPQGMPPVLDPYAESAVDKAKTPAEIQAAAKKIQAAAQEAPPEVRQALDAAVAKAQVASTAGEVAVAKAEIQSALGKLREETPFYAREWLGVPAWAWGAGGLAAAAITWITLRHGPRVVAAVTK